MTTKPMLRPMLGLRGKHRHLASTQDICQCCGICVSLCGLLMDRKRTEAAHLTGRWKPDCKACTKLL